MAWDSGRKVRFDLPFPAQQLELYLDPLLPRIAECAEHAGQREVQVASCEALQAVLTLMVAEQARGVRGKVAPPQSPHRLYEKLFPVALRLASGNDPVPRQIFRPFVFQVGRLTLDESGGRDQRRPSTC